MAYDRIKTEHAGAKNGGGAWMTHTEAKRKRRQLDKKQQEEGPEPEMAELPERWRTFEDGTPVPNWVAAVDEARRGR
jgi:hypothetical protein